MHELELRRVADDKKQPGAIMQAIRTLSWNQESRRLSGQVFGEAELRLGLADLTSAALI
jgi:hypothetical protein